MARRNGHGARLLAVILVILARHSQRHACVWYSCVLMCARACAHCSCLTGHTSRRLCQTCCVFDKHTQSVFLRALWTLRSLCFYLRVSLLVYARLHVRVRVRVCACGKQGAASCAAS